MDKFDDDNLRDVFSKLKGYESPKAGITWELLSRHLGQRGFSKAAMFSIVLFLIALSSLYFLSSQPPQLGSATPNTNTPEGTSPVIFKGESAKKSISTLVNSDSKPIVLQRKNVNAGKKTNSSIQPLGDQSKVETDHMESGTLLIKQNDNAAIEGEEADQVQKSENIVIPDKSENEVTIDSVNTKGTKRKYFAVQLSSFYSFGIVQPLPSDNVILRSYQSKPGYGLKLNVMLPVITGRRYSIELGSAYQFFRKEFDFETKNLGPESITEKTFKRSLNSHLLGVNLLYAMHQRGLVVGASVMRLVPGKNPIQNFVGSSLLFFNAVKEVPMKQENLYLQLGISAGIPLTGPITTFRYYPIQLSVGLRNVVVSNKP